MPEGARASTSLNQVRVIRNLIRRHRVWIPGLIILFAALIWIAARLERDPFRERVFDSMQTGMTLQEVRNVIDRWVIENHGIAHENLDRSASNDEDSLKLYGSTEYEWSCDGRHVFVNFGRDGRLVHKQYYRDPSTGLLDRVCDWLGDFVRN